MKNPLKAMKPKEEHKRDKVVGNVRRNLKSPDRSSSNNNNDHRSKSRTGGKKGG
jgi:hypothetical protein